MVTFSPYENCGICGSPFADRELVLVESGQFLPMKKDPNSMRFKTDWKRPADDRPETAVMRLVHFDRCFITLFDRAGLLWRSDPSPHKCHACGHSFRKDRWAFRYTVGELNADMDFDPDPEIPFKGILCSKCTMAVFGEKQNRRVYDLAL
jgi:hypothetical protein